LTAAGLRPGFFAAGATAFAVRPVARLAAAVVRPLERRVVAFTAIACVRGVPPLLSSVLMVW
jgi:hypothetical protein